MTMSESRAPLVKLTASPKGPKCPFGNSGVEIELRKGSCVWLSGDSGLGKTTLSTFLAGLYNRSVLNKLDMQVECSWDDTIPTSERCGVLFQNTTLLDELTVAGNLCVALRAARHHNSAGGGMERPIKALLEMVGLDYQRDANKKPSQLSGGMARRASLALQMAQRKRVIVLDEPFAGLDQTAAASVAKELVHLRKTHGTALLLISHEPHLAKMVMADFDNATVLLKQPTQAESNGWHSADGSKRIKPNLFGTTFFQRFLERLTDYICWSMPLILLTFLACGLAIAMLSADILRRIDVTDRVLGIVDEEIKPLLAMVNGGEVNSFHLMAVKMKVRSMMNSTIPQAKAALYALGMANLFVLEIGPLLTALLLCGRIGGSYAGKVATMQATSETKLLRTLGINPQTWTILPSLGAALIASPILTVTGTALALALGAMVGPQYGIGDSESYWKQVKESCFPELRLRSLSPFWQGHTEGEAIPTPPTLWDAAIANRDLRTTWSDSYYDIAVEVVTYPAVFHLLKSLAYMSITLLTAESCARARPNLTPRNVPSVITSAVVLSSLLVIGADWGFSQLLLLRV
jgi:ABC-type nitrate/sulfonate/bicarbonate transport system ATPase subunit/ABC-type transporter Mla maintaining outer membrane lipid asymmetry permease subunit MlaE